MKGFGFKIFPFILLACFIAVMTTGSLLKKPLAKDDDVMLFIDNVKSDVKEEKWELAKDELEKLEKAWKKVVIRIQFSSERDEIKQLQRIIERTRGYVDAKDKGGALSDLAEAEFIWTELGK